MGRLSLRFDFRMDAHAAIFQKKYDEFVADLKSTFPELDDDKSYGVLP